MRKPKLYVLLRKADGLSVTIPLDRVDSYTYEEMLGHAGRYDLPGGDRHRLKVNEQYVFFTDNYQVESIDGKRCIGQKAGSVVAVPIMEGQSDAPGENYAVLLRTHAFAEGYRTLKGERKIPWTIVIAVLTVVALAGMALFALRGFGGEEAPVEVPGEGVNIRREVNGEFS